MAGPFGVRSPLMLFGAAVVVLGGIAVASATQLSRLKGELAQRQDAIQLLKAQNAGLEQQMAAVQEERRTMEERLNELRGQLSAANGELNRLRGSAKDMQAQYDALAADKASLEAQVVQLTRERDEATDRLTQLDEEKRELERASARLRERFTLLDRDYQRLVEKVAAMEQPQGLGSEAPASAVPSVSTVPPPSSALTPSVSQDLSEETAKSGPPAGQTVELPPIVVRKEQAGTGLPIRARLVEVNGTHRFVVLDKGANDGIRVGMVFDVVRGGAVVGQASAVRVRPQLAACDLITSRSPHVPQVGDLAIQRNP